MSEKMVKVRMKPEGKGYAFILTREGKEVILKKDEKDIRKALDRAKRIAYNHGCKISWVNGQEIDIFKNTGFIQN